MTRYTSEGVVAAPYRSPLHIRADMRAVRERIREVSSRTDIRDMVVASIADMGDARGAIRILEGIVDDARRALATLKELEEELKLLEEELWELT